ncbi:MAG: hypothetical protein JWR10_3650 [Rubritepida sp.]|nr:hypothetical protein [Rubritepida sp.]
MFSFMDGGNKPSLGFLAVPDWLQPSTVAAMRNAEQHARARGRDGAAEAWEVAWGHHPALPATMINEAVAAVLAPSFIARPPR